jgi:hypothetical protein
MNDYSEGTGILWRIILVFAGFTIATVGFGLIMSVFLAYIGLPVFSLWVGSGPGAGRLGLGELVRDSAGEGQ